MSASLRAYASWIARDLLGPCKVDGGACEAHGGTVKADNYARTCTQIETAAETVLTRLTRIAGVGEDVPGPSRSLRYGWRREADGRVTECPDARSAAAAAAVSQYSGEHAVIVVRDVWAGPWTEAHDIG